MSIEHSASLEMKVLEMCMLAPLTNASCLFNETANEFSTLCLLTRGTRLGIYAALVFCTILNHFARGAAFCIVSGDFNGTNSCGKSITLNKI